MGLRNADALASWFGQTITLAPRTGHTGTKPTYGAAVSHAARIELRTRLTRNASGQEVTARGKVFIRTQTIPSGEDELVLPAGLEPTKPPILNIAPKYTPTNEVDHVVVDFGFGGGTVA